MSILDFVAVVFRFQGAATTCEEHGLGLGSGEKHEWTRFC